MQVPSAVHSKHITWPSQQMPQLSWLFCSAWMAGAAKATARSPAKTRVSFILMVMVLFVVLVLLDRT